MIVYCLLSYFVQRLLFSGLTEKEKVLKRMGQYIGIKKFANLLAGYGITFLTLTLIDYRNKTLAIFLSIVMGFVINTIDMLMIYRPYVKIRGIQISRMEYLGIVAVNTFLMYFFAFMVGVSFLGKEMIEKMSAYSQIAYYCIFLLAASWGYRALQKWNMKARECDNDIMSQIHHCYGLKRSRFMLFDGKKLKTANAYVESMFGKSNIYYSDYLAENLTREENTAIYLHEMGHLVKHHLTIRKIMSFASVLLIYLIAFFFDFLEKNNISVSIPVGIAVMIVWIAGILFLELWIYRKQECSADLYAIEKGVDPKDVISGLIKLSELNDGIRGKKTDITNTHPSIDRRIAKIKMFSEGYDK